MKIGKVPENVLERSVFKQLHIVTDKLEEYETKLKLYHNDLVLNDKLNKLEKYTNEDGLKIIEEIREIFNIY